MSLSVWLVSLLAVYLPTIRGGIPTFSSTIDANVMRIFLISTVLTSFTSLLLGLHELCELSILKNRIRHLFKFRRSEWRQTHNAESAKTSALSPVFAGSKCRKKRESRPPHQKSLFSE